MPEKTQLYHLLLPHSTNASLELLKRLTGLHKSELIRAAVDIYLEKRFKEFEPMILAMEGAIRVTSPID